VTRGQGRVEMVEPAERTQWEEVVCMTAIGEGAIRAADFAGLVPASRDAHCRPLHPRLASLCFRGERDMTDPRPCWRPGLGRSDLDRQGLQIGPRRLLSGAAHRRAGSREIHINTFDVVMIIGFWRDFRGGVAVI